MSKNKTRKTKKEIYSEERNEIINQINKILRVEENNIIFFCDIRSNEELKKYLSDNIDNIKKYYKTSRWGFFSETEIQGKGNLIGLLRSIYKDSDYEILKREKYCTLYGVKKQYTQWDIRKINA